MGTRRANELLYDSEAALRLVDNELELGYGGEPVPAPAAAPLPAWPDPPSSPAAGLSALPVMLDRASAEIHGVLATLRDSRAALETAAVERLTQMRAKLKEVTSATEVATTDILDGLDRAQGLIDDLDEADAVGDRVRGQSTRDLLREEIFAMMGCLQFQDITTQQLSHTASVMTDMEGRLLEIAKLFDPASGLLHECALDAADAGSFAPDASTRGAGPRQRVADEVFEAGRLTAPR